MTVGPAAPRQKTTGVAGLDDVLAGGFAPGRMFLIEGRAGTGKTTIALRFLLEGAAVGERGLYVTLSETEAELRDDAASHGWTVGDAIQFCEPAPPESLLDPGQQQSLLYSSDLELGETTHAVFEAVARCSPQRLVLDSLSEIRLLAQGPLRYRRQMLALKHYFARHGVTVLLLDDLTVDIGDKTIHSIAHGVVQLGDSMPAYGAERRSLRILKFRGRAFRGGNHDYVIRTGSVEVFPRLVAAEHRRGRAHPQLSSGIAALDGLTGGGLEQGTSTLVLGPAGAGKTLLTLQFAMAAIARGQRAALFVFDEELGLLFDRSRAMGLDLEAARDAGSLFVEQVDAAELSPGEFTHKVRRSLDDDDVGVVVIDSLNGYQAAMPEADSLILHLHELLQYLNRQGVATFVTVAQHGLFGQVEAPVDVTYLADTVVLLRYFEAAGEVRRAISVIKKRAGQHEATIRELQIAADGLRVGEPLSSFHGVLTGVPSYVGRNEPLLGRPVGSEPG